MALVRSFACNKQNPTSPRHIVRAANSAGPLPPLSVRRVLTRRSCFLRLEVISIISGTFGLAFQRGLGIRRAWHSFGLGSGWSGLVQQRSAGFRSCVLRVGWGRPEGLRLSIGLGGLAPGFATRAGMALVV